MKESYADYLLMRRLTTRDCPTCCQPTRHRGDCCVLCVERAKPAPVTLRRPS